MDSSRYAIFNSLFGAHGLTISFQCVLGLGTVVGQAAGGLLVHYFRRHHRWILIASTISLTAFSAAMVSVNLDDRAKGIAFMLLACFSVGIIETASLSLAPLTCPPEDLGVALGTLGSIRSAGGSICSTSTSLLTYEYCGLGVNVNQLPYISRFSTISLAALRRRKSPWLQ